jgi:hypothetical protein
MPYPLLPSPSCTAHAAAASSCPAPVPTLLPARPRWSAKGSVFLSNVRLVFLADAPDASGLAGFDLPLVYITGDKLNQPIFGCNNLSGRVWPAAEGGGPAGSLPPHDWKVSFRNGGVGTFYPLFYALVQRARRAGAAEKAPDLVAVKEDVGKLARTAFVGARAAGAWRRGTGLVRVACRAPRNFYPRRSQPPRPSTPSHRPQRPHDRVSDAARC